MCGKLSKAGGTTRRVMRGRKANVCLRVKGKRQRQTSVQANPTTKAERRGFSTLREGREGEVGDRGAICLQNAWANVPQINPPCPRRRKGQSKRHVRNKRQGRTSKARVQGGRQTHAHAHPPTTKPKGRAENGQNEEEAEMRAGQVFKEVQAAAAARQTRREARRAEVCRASKEARGGPPAHARGCPEG